MHRQSLGSSGSKLHLAHGVVLVGGSRDESAVVTAAESQKIMTKDQASPSSLSNNYDEGEEQVRKSIKALNKSLSRAEKYIHLIPVLTFLCFFILYLFSHSPSDKDLAQFQGFEGFAKRIESANIDDEFQRVLETKKPEVLAIRSVRNLQEIDRQDSNHRRHRKLADF
ncbi:uncharacterized protein LOC107026975 [Solanum pennellii]|uniref:Uncharacterized protein LOC107026975 n=1 Tax=Solanum pennellii TaxID=28526 RepID=A0ABM1HCQ2_SOLPN|nr:uncharacterized protein LOC107026975 [Solanum pennellii]